MEEAPLPLVICYPGFSGDVNIRTMRANDEVLVSLEDVVRVLSAENSQITAQYERKGLTGIASAMLNVLEEDERAILPIFDRRSGSAREEVFVTQPGLYRIVTRDDSKACKKFQRWLFHEVIPAIARYGTYPPPSVEPQSDLKAVVQLLSQNADALLKEIVERERLEKEVLVRFEKTEQQLADVTRRLEDLSLEHEADGYVSIRERCRQHAADVDYHQVWGWCTKICLERNIRIPSRINSERGEFVFPPEVIDDALQFLGHQESGPQESAQESGSE